MFNLNDKVDIDIYNRMNKSSLDKTGILNEKGNVKMLLFGKKSKIKRALEIALEDYDKETIIDILTYEEGGWHNGTEILNNIKPEDARRILNEM